MTAISILSLILFEPDTYIYIGWGILIVWALAALLVWHRCRRAWLRWLVALPLLPVAYIFLSGVYVGFSQLQVQRVELAFSDLPESFDGYKVVLFSDVHAGTLTGARQDLLRQAVDSINAQQADLVVFAGDLQNKLPTELAAVKPLLSQIKGKDGVYSVLGNHDYPMYVEGDVMQKQALMNARMEMDERLGWRLLRNARAIIVRDSDRIVIGGMDNDGGSDRFPRNGQIQQTLAGIYREDFVVMVEHDPTAWRRKILPECHAQLTLSGHTHGGQFSLFGWSPAQMMYSESQGLYQIADRYLYVTSGLSGVIPFRFGVPAEIAVITLRTKHSEK